MDGRLLTLARSPRILLAAITAVLALGGGAPAPAAEDGAPPQDRWPAGGAAMMTALEVAATHWAALPCGGAVDIRWTALPAGVEGRSTWAFEGDDGFGRPAANSDCEIELSTVDGWDWPKLCTIVLHEVGHLTGHPHAGDPHDVMYPRYTEPVADCAAEPEPDPAAAVVSTYRSSLPAATTRPAAKKPAAKARKPVKRAKRAKTPPRPRSKR